MQAPNPQQPGTWSIDPAFAYAPLGRLEPAPSCDPSEAWRHLSAQVARDPLDLEAHARRVVLASTTRQSAQAFTAVLDLFLALGTKGHGLRKMMLHQVEGVLSSEENEFLAQALETGLTRESDLPLGTYALLDPAWMGRLDMVQHQRQQAAAQSVVDQAAALIDQGDLAAARVLLEDALLDSPEDEAVASELLGIYRHSRDPEAKQAMAQRLLARHGRVSDTWA
jgi:hypothetical protein